jgi:hypothetical protein
MEWKTSTSAGGQKSETGQSRLLDGAPPPDPEVAVVAPREDLPPHPLVFYDVFENIICFPKWHGAFIRCI